MTEKGSLMYIKQKSNIWIIIIITTTENVRVAILEVTAKNFPKYIRVDYTDSRSPMCFK